MQNTKRVVNSKGYVAYLSDREDEQCTDVTRSDDQFVASVSYGMNYEEDLKRVVESIGPIEDNE